MISKEDVSFFKTADIKEDYPMSIFFWKGNTVAIDAFVTVIINI